MRFMLDGADDKERPWPGGAVLLSAALILLVGLGAAVWRGPSPGGEVRVVVFPATPPQP